MKKFFKMFGVVGLLAGMLMVGGCGSDDDSSSPAQGKVVKGPVVGATVTDSKGVVSPTKTDVNGNFPLFGTGPYTTSGGTYVPLKADGTPGTPVDAPPMSCPAGVTQITPLSTLVNEAQKTASSTTATQAQKDEAANLLAVIDANGGLNTDLSVKTEANAALLNLNETAGAIIVATSSSSTDAATAKAALIKSIATLPPSKLVVADAVTAITTVIKNETNLNPYVIAAAKDASDGAGIVKVGDALPTSTGSQSTTVVN